MERTQAEKDAFRDFLNQAAYIGIADRVIQGDVSSPAAPLTADQAAAVQVAILAATSVFIEKIDAAFRNI